MNELLGSNPGYRFGSSLGGRSAGARARAPHPFVAEAPKIDIVVDDGSHRSSDQVATLERWEPFLGCDPATSVGWAVTGSNRRPPACKARELPPPRGHWFALNKAFHALSGVVHVPLESHPFPDVPGAFGRWCPMSLGKPEPLTT